MGKGKHDRTRSNPARRRRTARRNAAKKHLLNHPNNRQGEGLHVPREDYADNMDNMTPSLRSVIITVLSLVCIAWGFFVISQL